MIHPLATLLLGASLVAPAAGEVPKLDVEKTCRSAGSAGSGNSRAATDGCLRSERQARDDLVRRWSQFSAPAKRQCSEETRIGGDFPSYVELLTCLELATGSFPARGPDEGGAANPAGSVGTRTGRPR